MSAAENRAGNGQTVVNLATRRKNLVADAEKFSEELRRYLELLAKHEFNVDAETDPGLNIVEYWGTFARKEQIMAMTDTADLTSCGNIVGALMDNARELRSKLKSFKENHGDQRLTPPAQGSTTSHGVIPKVSTSMDRVSSPALNKSKNDIDKELHNIRKLVSEMRTILGDRRT